MMMVMKAFVVLILLGSMVVEADDHYQLVMYFSPQQPDSQILPSLPSNSSEDFLKHIGNFIPKIIEGAKTIIHKGEAPILGSKQNILGIGTGVRSKIYEQKISTISLDTPSLPPPPPPPLTPLHLSLPPSPPPPDSENENSTMSNHSNNVTLTFGVQMVKGLHDQYPMEDYTYAMTKSYGLLEGGIFALYDGYLSYKIPRYLHAQMQFYLRLPFLEPNKEHAARSLYRSLNKKIFDKAKVDINFGGSCASTAVTAILIKKSFESNYKLVVTNLGDSRAVISKSGVAKQLSVDHVPSNETERQEILKRGGYVKDSLGHGPCVNGSFPLSRAFGGVSYGQYISSEPNIAEQMIDGEIEFLELASQPLWKVMSNQEVVDSIREIKNSSEAAVHLIEQALKLPGFRHQDDISCIVVRFQ